MLYKQEDKLEYFKHGMRQFSNSTELLVTRSKENSNSFKGFRVKERS